MKDHREFTNYLGLPFGKKNKPAKVDPPPIKDKEYYVKMVEDFYRSLPDIDPAEHVLDNEEDFRSWRLYRGSTVTFISLDFRNGTHTLRMFSPLVYIPQSKILPIYRECLELNDRLFNCSLCTVKDVIGLVVRRPLEGLEPKDFESMTHYFTGVADDLDNALADKFGAKLCTD